MIIDGVVLKNPDIPSYYFFKDDGSFYHYHTTTMKRDDCGFVEDFDSFDCR